MAGTLVLLNGRHTINIKGREPSDLEPEIAKGKEDASPFIPLTHGKRGGSEVFLVDPVEVVGLVPLG